MLLTAKQTKFFKLFYRFTSQIYLIAYFNMQDYFKGADVNRKTSGGEHSVLSLACAGGHTAVVELLLGRGGNPAMKLKVSLFSK